MNTRQFIQGLSTLGIASLATSTSQAFFFSRPSSFSSVTPTSMDLDSLPSRWVEMNEKQIKDYYSYLKGLKLRNIQPAQIIEAHAKEKGGVWNTLPPRSMWRNITKTLKVVDVLSLEAQSPVREIVSVYRSPQYNARCSGAKRESLHQSNIAIDVKFACRPSTVSNSARKLRASGLFQGGIGRYSSFTHIDTRGQNVDW